MPEQEANRLAIYKWITENTPQGGRVLDLGCGEGDLLAQLAEQKKVRAVGIELSEESVMKAVQRGLSVHHGNIEEGLNDYGDNTFDSGPPQSYHPGIRRPIKSLAGSLSSGEASHHCLSQL